jgi:FG-GAP repeat
MSEAGFLAKVLGLIALWACQNCAMATASFLSQPAQGRFESAADQLALQQAYSKVSGGIRLDNPNDRELDGQANDRFGSDVAVSGNTAVIGAPGDDSSAGIDAGSVLVFVRNGASWDFQARINATGDGVSNDFGRVVAISGDTIVVGASNHMGVPALAGGGGAFVFVRVGSVWTQQAILVADDRAALDAFGTSVAIAGDTIAVGASGDNQERGAAYIYARSLGQWAQSAKLIANDADFGDQFGAAIALDGDTLLVGSPFEDSLGLGDNGAAYTFTRAAGTWSFQAKLTATGAREFDDFGFVVALSNNTALIGAPGNAAGAAFVFTRSGSVWSQQARLIQLNAIAQNCFGSAVALAGDTAIVGDPCNYSGTLFDVGATFVFQRSGVSWSQQARLAATDGAQSDKLGTSVAISGEIVLAGALNDATAAGSGAGSVQAFVRTASAWGNQAQLVLGDPARIDRFGYTVAISGDTALVSAPYAGPIDSNIGEVHVFVRSGTSWQWQAKIRPPDLAVNDYFGMRIAIDGDSALIAADTDLPLLNVGAVYVYVRSAGVWTQQAKLFASDGVANGLFGDALSLKGNTAAIRARNAADQNRGQIYVFERVGGTWSEQARLRANDQQLTDAFGISVALDIDTLVVGASNVSTPVLQGVGAVYVFDRTAGTWQQTAKLFAADATASANFGGDVAISGNTVMVSADGSAYVLTRSGVTWTQQAKFLSSNTSFAPTIALLGDTAAVGDAFHNTHGAVWIYQRTGAAWALPQPLTAGVGNALGDSVALGENDVIAGSYSAVSPFVGNGAVGAAFVFSIADPIFQNGFD